MSTSGFWQRVRGGSMAPTLRDGDEVRLEPISPFAEGDVVVARVPGRTGTILHRVVARDGRTVITRGDACRTNDPVLPSASVLFRATALRRGMVVRPIPPAPGPATRWLWRRWRRLAGAAGAPGRWWRARRSSSTSTGGSSSG